MTWDYTGTSSGTVGSFVDYTSATTTANSYFDHITNRYWYGTGDDYFNRSQYATVGTGDNYFSQGYCTTPLEIPRSARPEEQQPRSQPCQYSQPPKPSPEEIDAQVKARNLLLEYLDQDNKRKYLEKKPIEVVSKLFGDIRYQIPISKLDKICALKDGKIVSRLCLVVREPEHIPLEDIILTKFLHILNDEECVLRTANHFDVRENLLARLN